MPGGQRYRPVNRAIPADWSSATFFVGAGAMPGNEVVLHGLDLKDTQGDKAMRGVRAANGGGGHGRRGGDSGAGRSGLVGCELDLNDTPDALPMLAVLGCFAQGTTRLVNVPQARIKETDRIAVMAAELGKLGARMEELAGRADRAPERVARGGGGRTWRSSGGDGAGGGRVRGPGRTVIHGAEAAAVTFPEFVELHEGARSGDLKS